MAHCASGALRRPRPAFSWGRVASAPSTRASWPGRTWPSRSSTRSCTSSLRPARGERWRRCSRPSCRPWGASVTPTWSGCWATPGARRERVAWRAAARRQSQGQAGAPSWQTRHGTAHAAGEVRSPYDIERAPALQLKDKNETSPPLCPPPIAKSPVVSRYAYQFMNM